MGDGGMSALTDREACRIYAQTRQHRYRVAKTLTIIEKALMTNNAWLIAVSGGKDSTVVMNCVRLVNPDIPAVCSVYEWMLPETRTYVQHLENCEHVASGTKQTEFSANWEHETDLPDGVRWIGGDGQTQKRYGRQENGVFLGLRKEESARRRIHLATLGSLFYAENNQCWQCSPIADWSVEDVWAFILSRDIPYNAAYDVLTSLDIPLKYQRIGALAVRSVLGYGQLAILKRGWIDLYNAYVARYPEARLYT